MCVGQKHSSFTKIRVSKVIKNLPSIMPQDFITIVNCHEEIVDKYLSNQ